MTDDHPFAHDLLAPLTRDLELRPRGETPASLRRLLRPVQERCVRDIEDCTARLKALADEASSIQDLKAESALRAKIVDQCTQLLRLCRDAPGSEVDEPRPLRSQANVPNWREIPVEVRRKFLESRIEWDSRLLKDLEAVSDGAATEDGGDRGRTR